MEQTKPRFIIKKYRSVLRAAIIVEAVSYIVSLTDSIVAGNIVGDAAFVAIGLLAPFIAVSTFFASVVNSGTVINYSYYVGRFDKNRANGIFSQGVLMSLAIGAVFSAILFIVKEPLASLLTDDAEVAAYILQYFDLFLLVLFLTPISVLFDNMLIADGGEKLSATANVVNIISNVVLSVMFASMWDIMGIALATLTSKIIYMLIICVHFLSKKNHLKFILHWEKKDFIIIIKGGIVKASTYLLEGIMVFSINLFAMVYFDDETTTILIVVEKILGLTTLFIGLAMSAQPLIGTLRGEKNTKALRQLMITVLNDMTAVSLLISVLVIIFAPFLAYAFGIEGGVLHTKAVFAIRIVGSTLVVHAILVMFFIYYVLINRNTLAFIICLHKNFISPMVLGVLLSVIFKSQSALWVGLAAAPFVVILCSFQRVYKRYGKEMFPFLISKTNDDHIYVYDYKIEPDVSAELSSTVQSELKKMSVSERTCVLSAVFVEDVLMLVFEKNPGKKLYGECNLIVNEDGVRINMRDSGRMFDVLDEDAKIGSFRQYIVSNMIVKLDYKAYMVTTGYNRIEILIKEG